MIYSKFFKCPLLLRADMDISNKIEEESPKTIDSKDSTKKDLDTRIQGKIKKLRGEIKDHIKEIDKLEDEILLYEKPWIYYRKCHKGVPRKKLLKTCRRLYYLLKERGELNFLTRKRRLFRNQYMNERKSLSKKVAQTSNALDL